MICVRNQAKLIVANCIVLFVIAQAVSVVPKSWKKPNEDVLMVETRENEVR